MDGQETLKIAFTGITTSLEFYWPNRDKAPWHIQCVTKIGDDDVEMNFWPHKSKGQFKYEKAIEPLSAFIYELRKRINEAEREEDFDVVE